MKKEREWERKIREYEFRYEIARERIKISGYALIHLTNRVAEAQHISEKEALQAIQRHTLKGEPEEVHKFLLEFPEFKR